MPVRRMMLLAATIAMLAATPALAQKQYGPGVSDTEIKIGQTIPHSGPGSLYGVLGRVGEAYFQMLNEKGGINGRKIQFITYDDAYSPPKSVEQTRKLIESDEVAFLFSPLGTPGLSATVKYVNAKKVPHLFVVSGATKFTNFAEFPMTTTGIPAPVASLCKL